MNHSRSAWWLLVVLALGIALALSMRSERVVGGASGWSHGDGDSIDPFIATPGELLFLPGIGPKLARSMHHGIRVDGIHSLEELDRLTGIGPARAAAIRDATRSSGR
jgi:hypothetical protein